MQVVSSSSPASSSYSYPLPTTIPSSSSFSCRPDQRLALLLFIHTLSITGPKLASWRWVEDCCSWQGVTCNSSTGDIIGLDSTFADLRGSINSNSSLFSLRHLRHLALAGSDFLGSTVPMEIGALAQLEYFDLSNSNFTGAVPNSIGNLSRLTYLDLSGNNFTIDLGILSTMEDLVYLDLSGFSISGEDANHDFSLPKLQILKMESCNLSKFPSVLSRSEELEFLDLSGNMIQEIPDWLWSIGIKALYLYDNIIRGSISPSICRLTSLSYVNLNGNHLTGVIPQCLGNLTKLQELGLSNNSLSGPLPPSLVNLTYLLELDVDSNMLEGPLPMLPTSILDFRGQNNRFSWSIPSSICQLTSLPAIDLSQNHLTGVIPQCLDNLTGLEFLSLRENELGDKIPEIFHKGSRLKSLDLSRNQFEGALSRSLSNCKSLEALDLGGNNIADYFPRSLGDLPLKVLSLRSNNFYGDVLISMETHNFSQVRIMDLSNNNFEGNITDKFIGELLSMARDNFYNFSGDLYMHLYYGSREYYSVMINLKGVETEMVKINIRFALLDLSSNHFQGDIPKSIGLLRSLKSMNLSHNRFKGTIPPSIGNLTDLESLDLSSNLLMGEIPKELVKMTFLKFFDLSRNNLMGPIPLGGHFNTFSNSSFQRNPELCGIPLMRSCGQEVQPPSKGKDVGEEDGVWLEWKYVVLGFGSGMGMGISLGYMVLEMGRPLWLVRAVIRLKASYRKMSRRNGDQRRNG